MDQDGFLLHIVNHVKPFLPKVENQYEQYLHDEVDPFGLAMTWKGVTLMERNGKTSRKLGSTFTIDADGDVVLACTECGLRGRTSGSTRRKLDRYSMAVCMIRQPSWSGASRSMVVQGWRAA